jgi:hypothetical protein
MLWPWNYFRLKIGNNIGWLRLKLLLVRQKKIRIMVFAKNAILYFEKFAKFAENIDHNIDPWMGCLNKLVATENLIWPAAIVQDKIIQTVFNIVDLMIFKIGIQRICLIWQYYVLAKTNTTSAGANSFWPFVHSNIAKLQKFEMYIYVRSTTLMPS